MFERHSAFAGRGFRPMPGMNTLREIDERRERESAHPQREVPIDQLERWYDILNRTTADVSHIASNADAELVLEEVEAVRDEIYSFLRG